MKTRISGLKFHPQNNSAVLRASAANPLPDFNFGPDHYRVLVKNFTSWVPLSIFNAPSQS